MNLSIDTIEILKFLDLTSGNNLRKRNDLGIILEIGATFNQPELIDEIIFKGMYFWNISTTLKKTTNPDELKLLQSEFDKTNLEFRYHLKELIENGDEPSKLRFEEIYLRDNNGSVNNLIDLAHDLSELKEVQITLKHNS